MRGAGESRGMRGRLGKGGGGLRTGGGADRGKWVGVVGGGEGVMGEVDWGKEVGGGGHG